MRELRAVLAHAVALVKPRRECRSWPEADGQLAGQESRIVALCGRISAKTAAGSGTFLSEDPSLVERGRLGEEVLDDV